MTHRDDPVTKGYVRKVAFWGALLMALFILGIQFKGSVDTALSLRSSCERANVQRQALYRNTVRDAESRATAISQFTGTSQAEIALQAIGSYTDAQNLVNTYASVTERPGSVSQDCDVVYPLPFPL